MTALSRTKPGSCDASARVRGFTIVELMIAMTLSLMVLVALVSVFVNTSRSQAEMTKTNGLIENGRIAVQLLQEDIVHAGFWGGFLPAFDDMTATATPDDAPSVVPDPCKAYSTWNSDDRAGLIGVGVQTTDVVPSGTGCQSPLVKRAGSDVLIVRHLETCVPGSGNCEADTVGRRYFQPSFCGAEKNAGVVSGATSNSVTLGGSASTTTDIYNGVAIRLVSGTGAGQVRTVRAYAGSSRIATLDKAWSVIPDGTTAYSFDYAFGVASLPLHRRDCVGTGTPATLPLTAGTLAEKRRFESSIYYIVDVAHPERAGEVVPTLVRAKFDTVAGSIGHQPPQTLIEGIENFRVELGIDDTSDAGLPVDYSAPVDWADTTKTSPQNRGDGVPDRFIRCTTAAPCTAGELSNVVAVKLYVLARARDATPGHTDSRTYCLGETDGAGACPAANSVAATNDAYKRHVFTTSVRLTNISGRRETP
jgi:Tfp pilus assembly protein PilW